TYNNLPQPHYDDCPTAGVSDPGSKSSFGFGTWNAQAIVNSLTYKGIWFFTPYNNPTFYPASSTSVAISWQEVEESICPFMNIWCMAGVDGGVLMSKNSSGSPLTLTRGKLDYYQWCLPTGTNCTYPYRTASAEDDYISLRP
ncbi:MAG: hypothetical protein WA865_08590, partial [Spirulinaceae cyanobacterium]